jgi:hypothetical protein
MRTIDVENDFEYLSLLASTGQPSFREEHVIVPKVDPIDINYNGLKSNTEK